mmetsp:Transcript_15353/g.22664  ORF Transcript_15353/g.22664 Transcript_15353/m.22664 type:complete len:505 (+) Transcript_15353:87-1601(+)
MALTSTDHPVEDISIDSTVEDIPVEERGQHQQEEEIPRETQENWYDTAAGVMGNVLEWYDFALFGFLSDIIAQVFFAPDPNENEDNGNLIKTFVIFGGAFLARPIGGLFIGYVGDKKGRKEALTNSLFLMAIPTTVMGCLPTYNQVGVLAPILLSICRFAQGVSVGGQLPASLVYTVEKRDKSQWGYYGSLPMMAANTGTLLGNLCAAFMRQVLSEEQLVSWGWRLPFFSGILIAFVACYLKAHGTEVHTNEGVYDSATSEHTNPIRAAFRTTRNRLAILYVAMTTVLLAAGFYVTFVWMAIYMDELLDPPIKTAFWINTCSLFFGMTLILPLAGRLSDRHGRVTMMTLSAISIVALGPFLLILISRGQPFVAFLSQFLLGLMLSFYTGPFPAYMMERFSPDVRLTSVSVGYDLAHALFGGFSPAVATALFNLNPYAPGFIYVGCGLIALVGIGLTHRYGGDQREGITEANDRDVELPPANGVLPVEDTEASSDPAEKELPAVT